eukprot:CAMPEP_0170072718 /NCGR_PEP_ID=MMETSP0019_2-20121128/10301_1 /TAXON_ID=98059 /ORGANISM="Dinobryon sp., Strain UTEXLB2267" /LENGTH=86 /DNA_ID=CAMNT_0010281859 /DNA_START=198 /DNA_END=458 /DNA_ORIENTATION=+
MAALWVSAVIALPMTLSMAASTVASMDWKTVDMIAAMWVGGLNGKIDDCIDGVEEMAALWVSAIIASWAGNHNGDSDGCIDGVEEG